MSLEDLKKRIGYKEGPYDLAFEIGQTIIDARIKRGLTQAKLARKAKTKQPAIARLESSTRLPSLTFLKRVADAMRMDIVITFKERI